MRQQPASDFCFVFFFSFIRLPIFSSFHEDLTCHLKVSRECHFKGGRKTCDISTVFSAPNVYEVHEWVSGQQQNCLSFSFVYTRRMRERLDLRHPAAISSAFDFRPVLWCSGGGPGVATRWACPAALRPLKNVSTFPPRSFTRVFASFRVSYAIGIYQLIHCRH